MLSEENKNKIIKTGLYKHEPDSKLRGSLYAFDLYWCMNWTFRPSFYKDGVVMFDTYFNKSFELTDENFNEFELIFDFNEVERTNYPEDYEDSDVYNNIRVDSGGLSGAQFFIKKGAKKSKEKLLKKKEEEIDSLTRKLENAKRDLEEIKSGVYWELTH